MPQIVQSEEVAGPGCNRADQRRAKHVVQQRPRLISIADGYRYVGVGRSKFYTDFLPRLRTVKVGRRNLVDINSLDLLVDELLGEPGAA